MRSMTDRKKKKPSDIWWDEYFNNLMKDFLQIIAKTEKEFRSMENIFRDVEKQQYAPLFFSIRITQDGKNPPRIEIERSPPRVQPIEEERPRRIEIKEKKPAAKAEGVKYEEAPYTYNVDINQVKVEINVEGVESEDNVDLNFRKESIEIKVYSPKTGKGYYAILPLPAYVDPERTEIEVKKDKVIIKIPRRQTLAEEEEW
jgi:hypothetical protein